MASVFPVVIPIICLVTLVSGQSRFFDTSNDNLNVLYNYGDILRPAGMGPTAARAIPATSAVTLDSLAARPRQQTRVYRIRGGMRGSARLANRPLAELIYDSGRLNSLGGSFVNNYGLGNGLERMYDLSMNPGFNTLSNGFVLRQDPFGNAATGLGNIYI